jgi:TetR/AcrR family transcriptional regulator
MLEATLPNPKIDGDRTRAAILRAAQRLFVEFGFSATSMATVAKEAGVTKSLIHHHFGSKRELWDAVRTTVMGEYQRQQSQMMRERTPDLSLVEDSFIFYFRFLQANPEWTRLWNWMVIEGDAHCATLNQELCAGALHILRTLQESGEVRKDIEPEYMLSQFFGLTRGWFTERRIIQACLLPGVPADTTDERYMRGAVKVLMEGLRAR